MSEYAFYMPSICQQYANYMVTICQRLLYNVEFGILTAKLAVPEGRQSNLELVGFADYSIMSYSMKN